MGLAIFATLALVLWVLTSTSTPPTKTAAWRIQPDQFPLGTVLQGSQVEMSLGVFSGLRPSPVPSFITRLPSPIRKPCEWGIERFRDLRAKSGWRLKVAAPDFLKVDESDIQFHSSQGPFAFVSMSLKTDRPGSWNGDLVLHLSSATYAPTNVVVPVSVTVIAAPVIARRVLVLTCNDIRYIV
jgi:hypothetical protein